MYVQLNRKHEALVRSSPEQYHLSILGAIYLDGVCVDAERLDKELGNCQSNLTLTELLQRLNGFYAWIEETPGQVRAGVDHIRSRPLFYGVSDGELYLSDDADWVRQQVDDWVMDPIAREEFQLTGYVTGGDTLFHRVKQLQAGECLTARRTDVGTVVETQRYCRYLHQEPIKFNEADLFSELDGVALMSIQRLIDYAKGRQIVLPLSGGYDSRLIATLLTRLGYQNLLTFSYGVPGNQESNYSKCVAEALGLNWHFIEYNEALWRETWQTDERRRYQQWATNWCSIAHEQDWLAVQKMKMAKVIDDDALFVPGHSGDFLAGSHIPPEAFKCHELKLDDIDAAILRKHYGLAPIKLFTSSEKEWRARIRDRTERESCSKPWEFVDGFEKWDWQERQAKYICNSVRVYEFYGYDWWMPLWDLELMRFWARVPLILRKGRSWYVEYVKGCYLSQTKGLARSSLSNAEDTSLFRRVMRHIFEKMKILWLVRYLRNQLRNMGINKLYKILHQSHFLLVGNDSQIVNALEKKGYSVIGAHVQFKLLDFEKSLTDVVSAKKTGHRT